jgi:hypothetical protein
LQEFEKDKSQIDTAMKEAGDYWLQMDAKSRKNLDKETYVEETARKYVKMKKSSFVRLRRSEALKSIPGAQERAGPSASTGRRCVVPPPPIPPTRERGQSATKPQKNPIFVLET